MSGLCLKRTRPRALMQNLQTNWFDRAPRLTSHPSKPHNYKSGKSPMITTDNMHQEYVFRVCSVVLLVVQCYRFCLCCSFCLLALLHIPSWPGWEGGRGSRCMLYFVAAVALCVRVRGGGGGGGGGGGAGANLNTVKRIVTFTLESNQSYIHNNSSEKKENIQMHLKIPCTSCSDWQPSTMRVSIACFIALLLMLLLATVKVGVSWV